MIRGEGARGRGGIPNKVERERKARIKEEK